MTRVNVFLSSQSDFITVSYAVCHSSGTYFFVFFNMCHIHSSNFSDRAAAGNNNSRRVPLLVGIVIVYNGVIGELLFSKEKLLKRCGGMCVLVMYVA